MDTLRLLRRSDLRALLLAEHAEFPGRILWLNRKPKYHNQLDAIAISIEILEIRSSTCRSTFLSKLPDEVMGSSVSSPILPGSSSCTFQPGGTVVLLVKEAKNDDSLQHESP